jgi:hypothetical protein
MNSKPTMTWFRSKPDASTSSVLVPIVAPGEAMGRLLHVMASGSTAAPRAPVDDPRKLDPAIAPLFEHRLYRAGLAALGAISRVARWPTPLLGGLLARGDQGSRVVGTLTAINGQDFKGLTEENAGSAELGLALALLRLNAHGTSDAVYATGALDRGNSLAGVASRSVAVLPVGGLTAKLAAIGASLDAASTLPTRAILLLPETTLDAAATSEVHALDLARLTLKFAARGVALNTHPVATLDAALKVLDISTMNRPPRERAILTAILSAACVTGVALTAMVWRDATIQLAHKPLDIPGYQEVVTPFSARREGASGKFSPQPRCLGPDGMALYRTGEQLVMHIAVTNDGPVVRALGGHRFGVIGLSELSGVREWPEELIGSGDGSTLLLRIPIADTPPETNYVVVLAQRLRGFGGLALRDEVRAVMDRAPREERINAALTFLARRAPGVLNYKLATGTEDDNCRN